MPKLIVAIMYQKNKKKIYNLAKEGLIRKFGPISRESKPYNFDKFTSYYAKEMGKGLIKRFIIFKKQIKKEDLAKIRLFTAKIEKKYSKHNRRQINLDPGYLTKTELVLASFKRGTNYKEKISDKVYAHKVLEFKKGKVITFWHTFPDYREKKEIFLGLC